MFDENKFVSRYIKIVLGLITALFGVLAMVFGCNPNPSEGSVTAFALFSSLFIICLIAFVLVVLGLEAIDEAETFIDTLSDNTES